MRNTMNILGASMRIIGMILTIPSFLLAMPGMLLIFVGGVLEEESVEKDTLERRMEKELQK